MRPVESKARRVVHVTIPGVSLQFDIMYQIREAWSKVVLYHGLNIAVEWGAENPNAMTVL